MRIDMPRCNIKTCRNYSDGNCTNKKDYEKCEYTYVKGQLNREEPFLKDSNLVRVFENDDIIVDYNKTNSRYRVSLFLNHHFYDEHWFDAHNSDDGRKHGHWLLLDDCSNEGVYCSVCTKKVFRTDYANQKLKSKYCPNCGAIMDEPYKKL